MDHNPRAFPLYIEDEIDGSYNKGMTLRDWFAGMALSGLCASSIPGPHHDTYVEDAWRIADAMLDQRGK